MDPTRLHRECLVVDGHTDVPMRLDESRVDLTSECPDFHVDLPKLRRGGVDAAFFALYVPSALSPEGGWQHALHLHQLVVDQLVPQELELVTSGAQLRDSASRGAVAVLLGLENGRPLQLPGTLEQCAAMGVRYVTLTHIASHEWCDASTDSAVHGGLAPLGETLVRRMNELGVLVDVSHISDDAVRHVLAVSDVPVIASHSSCRALCDHPRNLPDELIRAIAAAGGVVMANSYPAFLAPEAARAADLRLQQLGPLLLAMDQVEDPSAAVMARQRLVREWPLPPVPMAAFVDHILHLVAVAGEEHVGIGTDFDGIPEVLVGFEDATRFPDLTLALFERGLDARAIRGILGENFLRVLDRAERRAAAA